MTKWEKHKEALYNLNGLELKAILADKKTRLENLYPIKNKRGQVIPFRMNKHQEDIFKIREAGLTPFIVKPRQIGISTMFCIDLLDEFLFKKGVNIAILAHKEENAEKLFKIIKFAHDNMIEEFKGSVSHVDTRTKHILESKERSSSIFASIEVRSEALTHVHYSELAFMDHDRYIATEGACSEHTLKSIESTPNGMNEFRTQYMDHKVDKESKTKVWFSPWFEEETYKMKIYDEEKFEGSIDHKDRQLMKQYNLSYEQMQWRRSKVKSMGELAFQQEYPENDIDCFLASGNAYFDQREIVKMQSRALKPIRTYFEGNLEVEQYFENLNEKDKDYYISVDPAEGVGRDFTAIQILALDKNKQIKQVCRMRGFANPIETARTIREFVFDVYGDYEPILTIERNNHGHAVLDAFLYNPDCRYGNLYVSRRDKRVGFKTTSITKHEMLGDLKAAIAEGHVDVNCAHTLSELQTMIVKDSKKVEADAGKKDDMVISLSLGVHTIVNELKFNPEAEFSKMRWTDANEISR